MEHTAKLEMSMFERPLFTCKWSRKGRVIRKLMTGDGEINGVTRDTVISKQDKGVSMKNLR